jgi:hydrogenase expression/formation protein HypC
MCLAIPGKIEAFVDADKRFARADISGVKRHISVDLLRDDGIDVGDWVLIHVGFAMSKISEEQALEQLQILAVLGEAAKAQEELAAGNAYDEDENVGPNIEANKLSSTVVE